MNQIPEIQHRKTAIDKLAAQRHIYSQAKLLLVVQIILSVPCVIVLSVLKIIMPDTAGFAALWGIGISAINGLLAVWERKLRTQAATIQELFDCEVLQLPWNTITAGKKPDPETIREYATKYKNKKKTSDLQEWYPTIVQKFPLHLARIICQRSNCKWDMRLREHYCTAIIAGVVVMTGLVLVLGLWKDSTFQNFLVTVAAPLLPAWLLFGKQWHANQNTIKKLSTLKDYTENTWQRALQNTMDEIFCEDISRKLQDEIFNHRTSCPLIFDRIYKRLRSGQETQMTFAAEEFVKEALRHMDMPNTQDGVFPTNRNLF